MFNKSKVISCIDVSGTISATSSRGREYSHYSLLEELEKVKEDDEIAGVLLRVNSPGGSAGASWELHKQIQRVAEEKPVYASISDIACSGAYLAIVGCKKIYASGMANVGSIGVIMEIPNAEGTIEKIGLKMKTIKSGDMKDIGNPFRAMKKNEQAFLQSVTSNDHQIFSNIVLKYRKNIPEEALTTTFDGRFFDAYSAQRLGLIDEIGTCYDAIDEMEKELGECKVKYDSKPKGLLNKILAKLNLGVDINLTGGALTCR